ncbi:MAG: AtpZ/AtpI family protein [Deltaproteobacteria bacterium]|nr:AtpZ/AtpI family protein [Deltaproteobacteria bacterium]
MKEDTKKFLRELFSGGYRASSIGLSLVFAIFIGAFLGYLLDNYFDTGYLFKIIGLIFGIIAGFRNVYILGKKFQDQK